MWVRSCTFLENAGRSTATGSRPAAAGAGARVRRGSTAGLGQGVGRVWGDGLPGCVQVSDLPHRWPHCVPHVACPLHRGLTGEGITSEWSSVGDKGTAAVG